MDELAAFLRARYDEEYGLALQAMQGYDVGRPKTLDDLMPEHRERRWGGRYEFLRVVDDEGFEKDLATVRGNYPAAGHIRRWQPRRVLAEIDARRRILDLHRHHRAADGWWCETCDSKDTDGAPEHCPTVRLLALPYAGHEDYRQEWKP